MSFGINKINNVSFKENYLKQQSDKQEPDNDFQQRDILISASDCLAAANKGGLKISISQLNRDDCNFDADIQSKKYFEKSIIPADEKILDGFKDGGRSQLREIICVDRKKDTKLQEMIDEVKEGVKDLPYYNPETDEYIDKEDYIFDYVKKTNICNNDAQKLPPRKEILLGDIIGTESACCRHLSLLFKILCDETGVKCDLVRGSVRMPDDKFAPHAWNIVETDDGYSLFDCMLGISDIDYFGIYDSDAMDERLDDVYNAD